MIKQVVFAGAALLTLAALGGCANDGSLALSTGSIDQAEKAKIQRVDPACVSLMARIDALRKEGTPERIAKVATGKTKTASVKREALARMTELDVANREFQQKCSTLATPTPPKATAAAKTAAAAQAATTAAGQVAKPVAAAATNAAKAEAGKQAAAVQKKVEAKATAAVATAAASAAR